VLGVTGGPALGVVGIGATVVGPGGVGSIVVVVVVVDVVVVTARLMAMKRSASARLSKLSSCSTSAVDSASSCSRVRLLLASRVGSNHHTPPCRPW
jgi:hypothetical protein